jgi:hypothetical protein
MADGKNTKGLKSREVGVAPISEMKYTGHNSFITICVYLQTPDRRQGRTCAAALAASVAKLRSSQ